MIEIIIKFKEKFFFILCQHNRSKYFQVHHLEEYHMSFEILHSIVSNNGRQFNNKKVRNLCKELGIKKHFSTSHYPHANGKVEAVTK